MSYVVSMRPVHTDPKRMKALPVTDAKGRFLQVGRNVIGAYKSRHTKTHLQLGEVIAFGPCFVRTKRADGMCFTRKPTQVVMA